jgi:hypothetical protein
MQLAAAKYLFLCALARCLDAVSTLDHVGLQAYRSRATVQLEEKTAGIAENGASLISAPERCCACAAVLTYGLLNEMKSQQQIDAR